MSTTTEIKLANLLISLREGAEQANKIADTIEKALQAMYENDLQEEKQKPVVGAMPQHEQFSSSAINTNIVSLVKGEKFEWDLSPQNMVDLKDYCFIEVVSKNNSNIGFKFLSSTLGKIVITQHFSPEVHQLMEVGGRYVAHNVRKGKKLYWDMAMEIEGEHHSAVFKAKKLARLFAMEPK